MNCKKCGAVNEESSKFCGKCGQLLMQETFKAPVPLTNNVKLIIFVIVLGTLVVVIWRISFQKTTIKQDESASQKAEELSQVVQAVEPIAPVKEPAKAVQDTAPVITNSHGVWIEVESNGSTTEYVNPNTITKTGNMAMLRVLYDHKSPEFDHGNPYMSSIGQFQFDCREGQLRMLSVSAYSENMGSGYVVADVSDSTTWTPIESGTNNDVLLKIACGRWKNELQ